MPRHAFILGGTGQIGRAAASAFLDANWSVTISHRGRHPAPRDLVERGAKLVVVDRGNAAELSGALGTGADVLIDTTAYDRNHASQLIALQAHVGGFGVISSASVYRDDFGRTLDEAAQTGFPKLPEPIAETKQPSIPDRCPNRRAKSRWNGICSTMPLCPSQFCGPVRYTARTPGIRESGGWSSAFSIDGPLFHWPIEGQAAFIHLPRPTSPRWPASQLTCLRLAGARCSYR